MKSEKKSKIYFFIFIITVLFSNHCEKVYDDSLARMTQPLSYRIISQHTLLNRDCRPAILREIQNIKKMVFKKIKLYRVVKINENPKREDWKNYHNPSEILRPGSEGNGKYKQELCWLYYDVHGRIRKIAWNVSNKNKVSSLIEYFNSSGKLCYITFRSDSQNGINEYYSGHAFIKNGKMHHTDSYYFKDDTEKNYTHTGTSIYPKHFQVKQVKDQLENHPLMIAYHKRISELHNYLPIPNYPLELVSFTFQNAEENNRSFLNKENVPVYQAPSIRSELIAHLHAMEDVDILEIGYHFPKKYYQRNRWYKIKTGNNIEGWIFGGFIEPVEYQLTEKINS